MAFYILSSPFFLLLFFSAVLAFPPNFRPFWGFEHITVSGDGNVALSMDKESGGAGLISTASYTSGIFSASMKLIPGDSAGTICTFYLSSFGHGHHELDFEFRGNVSGEPITLQTNIYVNDVGGREQEVSLWFDPSQTFHTYSIFWNQHIAFFSVDGTVVRMHKNVAGAPYPGGQPMSALGSIWDGSNWATQGGRFKVNWSHAPFVVQYGKMEIAGAPAEVADISPEQREKLRWVQTRRTLYDYCLLTRDRAEATACKTNRA